MIRHKKVIQHKINSIAPDMPKTRQYSFVPVDKRFLHIGSKMHFNLYIPDEHTQMSLFLQSDTVIDTQHNKKLKQIEQLFTSKLEKSKYEHFLEKNIQNILDDNSLTLDEKTDIIYESSSELTHSLYNNPNALENAQRSKKIVSPILHSIPYHKDTISSYIKNIEYDYYTHTLSLNVSIYALWLGSPI